jgi:SRSO17 transposase
LQQRLLQQSALHTADELGTIGVIDETSVAKKGTKTPGVHRQYCGSSGSSTVTDFLTVFRSALS